jgi:hypothetical protein
MAKKYDIKLRTGEYTDQSGKTKGRYITAGAIFETKTGLMGKLEVIPTGDWNGTFFLSEPKQASELQDRVIDDPETVDNFNLNDIPF